ncbi:MAG: gliding motility-associated C-terminal domain-containing protein [Bacteroidota bacterium]
MNTNIGKIVFLVCLLFSGVHIAYSQCPVVINEVMVSPAGGASVNCFYNGDTLNGGDPTQGAEWIELYNTDPCNTADVSCYIIAFETSSGTGQNWGSFLLPGGTQIPPNGHLLIGGSNVPDADLNFNINNAAHCSSKIFCFKDSAGWVGLYNNGSFPIDAVYWNIGGTAADLVTWTEYTSEVNVNPNICTCCSPGVLASASNFPVAEFAGNVIPNSSITFARISDGSPVWVNDIAGGTPDTCNGGNANCNSVQIVFSLMPPTCVNSSDGSATADVNTTTYPQSPFSYLWSNGDTTQFINGLISGTYTVTITDKWGCQYIADTALTDPVPPVLSIVNNSPVCPGDFLLLSSGIGGLNYYWSGPDGFSSTQSAPVLAGFQQGNAGNYFLTMTDSNSCVLQDTVLVQIQPLPVVNLGPDTTICFHQPFLYNVDNGNTYTYLWSDGNTSPQNTINTGTTVPGTNPFWLWASATGCKTITDSVLVNIEYCEIEESNVMTPNGDNINDFFKINGLEKFPDSELYIFNRWGKIVYKSSDYQNDWNGNLCPDGVYYYILRIPNGTAGINEVKGWVTIIGKEN